MSGKPREPGLTDRLRAWLRTVPRWRKLLAGLSLLGFLIFFFPVFARIVNLANTAAMLGCLALAALFLWWPRVLALLGRLWKHGWGKLLLLISGLGLLTMGLLLLVLCCQVASKLRSVPQQPCPTVIVLGCQVRRSQPCALLSYRIRTAADYLNEHPDAVAILSGGQGPGEDITEASCMFRELTARGIDPARLYLEERSTSTRENIQYSKALMEREGLRGPAAIISNDFHIFRALRAAEDQGLEAEGLAAGSSWYSRPTYILREALGLIYYTLTE